MRRILAWLQEHPGGGWQERWVAAGADQDTRWLDALVADDPRVPAAKRGEMVHAVSYLMIARVEEAGAELGMQPPQLRDAVKAITRMILHTGRDIDQLTGEDIQEQREWFYQGWRSAGQGVHAAWDLLAYVGVLEPGSTLHGSDRLGPKPAEQLIDYHQVKCQPVRDLLVRYLKERSAALDHVSAGGLAATLAGLFWADIERHHPGISTIRLPAEVVEAWKHRIRTYTAADGTTRERKDYRVHLGRVRSCADDHRTTVKELLEAASAVDVGQEFTHGGTVYRRMLRKSYLKDPTLPRLDYVMAEDAATGAITNLTDKKDDAFWTWAVIETLRHTGVRIEELLAHPARRRLLPASRHR
ncbi:MAG TPA: hypothetical protein VGG16_08275 [Streptosporangiaceae bacterium]